MVQHTLQEAGQACLDDILRRHYRVQAVIGYGSHFYQDLRARVDEETDYRTVLDKKPDFLVVVPSRTQLFGELAEHYQWNNQTLAHLHALSVHTPYYFSFETPLVNIGVECRVPYKAGFVFEETLLGMRQRLERDIYLAGRISKPIVHIHTQQEFRTALRDAVSDARRHIARLALGTLPHTVTGEAIARRYLAVTYMAESYRVFETIPMLAHALGSSCTPKHLKLLNGRWLGKVPFREALEPILSEAIDGLVKRRQIMQDFYQTVYRNDRTGSSVLRIALYNLAGIAATVKNAATNSLGGGDNNAYLRRKFLG